MTNEQKPETDSIAKGVGRDLVQGAKSLLRWTGAGAVLGAAVLGGAGLYYFGQNGLLIGALAGAVIGGLAGAWMCYETSTEL